MTVAVLMDVNVEREAVVSVVVDTPVETEIAVDIVGVGDTKTMEGLEVEVSAPMDCEVC